jgi:hypothetical protein
MRIDFLPVADDVRCAAFVEGHAEAMVYHARSWLKLVAALTEAEVGYLTLSDDRDRCLAVAPLSLRRGSTGTIANSSPYFGSHGGILATDSESFRALADGLVQFLRDRQVVAANIIEPLFAADPSRYETLPIAETDRRTGQVKDLAGVGDRDALLESLGGLTRSNLKRKAWRAGLQMRWVADADALRMLFEMHHAEMTAKPGGNPKPRQFFEAVASQFEPGSGYRVYLAELDGTVVAGLLVLLWRDFVEYITPAARPEGRDSQALTGVIFEALLDAAREGRRWFNFGGTWASQQGLLAFKNSWGVVNRDYRYYVLDLGGLARLRQRDRADLLNEYRGFYVYPF